MRQRWELPALALTLVAIAGSLGAIGWSWTERATPAPLASTNLVRNQLGDERQGEFLLRHYRRGDGSMLRTTVQYTNGAHGEAKYRPDGTLETFTKVESSGFQLRASTFDAEGKRVLDGFELRDDHTPLWQTKMLPGRKLQTVTYWRDGKQPFSIRTTDMSNDLIELVYFRPDGTIWIRQVAYFIGNPMQETVYNEAGLPQRIFRRKDDGAPLLQYFRPDGTLHFAQSYVQEDVENRTSSTRLDTTTVFSDDGKRPVLVFDWNYGPLPRIITEVQGDGIEVQHFFDGRNPSAKKVYGPNNTLISETDKAADASLLDLILPGFYVSSPPPRENPVPVWEAAESR